MCVNGSSVGVGFFVVVVVVVVTVVGGLIVPAKSMIPVNRKSKQAQDCIGHSWSSSVCFGNNFKGAKPSLKIPVEKRENIDLYFFCQPECIE